jgi:hypothetical protein
MRDGRVACVWRHPKGGRAPGVDRASVAVRQQVEQGYWDCVWLMQFSPRGRPEAAVTGGPFATDARLAVLNGWSIIGHTS